MFKQDSQVYNFKNCCATSVHIFNALSQCDVSDLN